jgi:hypothetical protein
MFFSLGFFWALLVLLEVSVIFFVFLKSHWLSCPNTVGLEIVRNTIRGMHSEYVIESL